MPEPIAFLNSQSIPVSQAKINIYDLGIILGATLTEMTRTFNHEPFRLDDHVARLFRSLKVAGFPMRISREQLTQQTHVLIEANAKLIGDEQDLGVVHFVTAGESPAYAGRPEPDGPTTSTVCIHSFPIPFEQYRDYFKTGVHVVTPAIRHVPPQCVDPKMKNRSRLHWYLANRQTYHVDPDAFTLLLDLDGNVTECAGSNFVIVKGDTIYSPTSRNILQGISLRTVRELAPQIGMKFVEKDLQPYDVVNADEAWLPTTPYCVAPCTRINTTPIGTGRPGPRHAKMIAAWNDLVGLDIVQQIMGEPARV